MRQLDHHPHPPLSSTRRLAPGLEQQRRGHRRLAVRALAEPDHAKEGHESLGAGLAAIRSADRMTVLRDAGLVSSHRTGGVVQ